MALSLTCTDNEGVEPHIDMWCQCVAKTNNTISITIQLSHVHVVELSLITKVINSFNLLSTLNLHSIYLLYLSDMISPMSKHILFLRFPSHGHVPLQVPTHHDCPINIFRGYIIHIYSYVKKGKGKCGLV